ncbi:MAG: nucleotidyltransferase domain-containing protein [Bacillota bacterium]
MASKTKIKGSFHFNQAERKKLVKELRDILEQEEIIQFAYLHGSFCEEGEFHDLDIAVYLSEQDKYKQFDYQLQLEDNLQKKLNFPVDIQILNQAPPAFSYMVIKKGRHLMVRNENLRTQFEMSTYHRYFDILPYRERYFREV